MHVVCRGPRQLRELVLPSTIWILRLELRPSNLHSRCFYYWATSVAHATYFFLSIHLFMGPWAGSMSWLSWRALWWAQVCRYLYRMTNFKDEILEVVHLTAVWSALLMFRRAIDGWLDIRCVSQHGSRKPFKTMNQPITGVSHTRFTDEQQEIFTSAFIKEPSPNRATVWRCSRETSVDMSEI